MAANDSTHAPGSGNPPDTTIEERRAVLLAQLQGRVERLEERNPSDREHRLLMRLANVEAAFWDFEVLVDTLWTVACVAPLQRSRADDVRRQANMVDHLAERLRAASMAMRRALHGDDDDEEEGPDA